MRSIYTGLNVRRAHRPLTDMPGWHWSVEHLPFKEHPCLREDGGSTMSLKSAGELEESEEHDGPRRRGLRGVALEMYFGLELMTLIADRLC